MWIIFIWLKNLVHFFSFFFLVVLDIPPVRPIAGKVFVIGQNDVGQLGIDDAERTRPTMLELPDNIVDIAAGGMHSVCLTENGEVWNFDIIQPFISFWLEASNKLRTVKVLKKVFSAVYTSIIFGKICL